MEGLCDHLARPWDSFLSSDHSHMSVNGMWVSFKSVVDRIDTYSVIVYII